MSVEGTNDPRFAAVREAFESCFADGLETGAAVAVMADGKLVADLWGGHSDAAGTRPWQRDTLVNVWSATKGVMATAIAMAVERGQLSYDAPMAKVWPEFAAGGKEAVTLDIAMSHRAGLQGLTTPMDEQGLYDWFPYVGALAAQAPLYEPGSLCVYHALSYGHLAGETLRRADGRFPGQFIAEEIAGPLGMDFFVGLPQEHDHRAAEMVEGPKASDWLELIDDSGWGQAMHNPDIRAGHPNRRAWRAAEIPGGNGMGDARALATLYGALAKGGALGSACLLSADGVAAATAERYRGPDASFGSDTAFGAGFRLAGEGGEMGPSAAAFGHSGWGGTQAFADPDAGIGFAFVTQRMLGFDDGIDPRRARLIDALYGAL
jgi:CubicO group peptidase (beta-lactamase class C family)